MRDIQYAQQLLSTLTKDRWKFSWKPDKHGVSWTVDNPRKLYAEQWTDQQMQAFVIEFFGLATDQPEYHLNIRDVKSITQALKVLVGGAR